MIKAIKRAIKGWFSSKLVMRPVVYYFNEISNNIKSGKIEEERKDLYCKFKGDISPRYAGCEKTTRIPIGLYEICWNGEKMLVSHTRTQISSEWLWWKRHDQYEEITMAKGNKKIRLGTIGEKIEKIEKCTFKKAIRITMTNGYSLIIV
jgi:hypothetical protein